MKIRTRLTLSVLAVSFFTQSPLSAQSEPKKPSYESVVYQDGEKYYVQKDLPVYLYFSTSKDGKKMPLTSQSHPEDADPMYLDTEGINYIRSKWAVDPETNQTIYPKREVLMPLYADGIAPRTSLDFSGAPVYRSSSATYYGKGLSFTLSARDGVSGVQTTQYALNGGYQNYSGRVNVTKEGAQTLYFFSADNVGNAESTDQASFTLDLTAPSTSHTINGIRHNGNILAPSTTFSLSSNDNLSGVNTTYYMIDDGNRYAYGGRINLSGLKDGEYTLGYYAKDNVENEESKNTFTFYLDRIPPEVSHAVVGDKYDGNYLYVSPRTEVSLSATDNKAGVKQIYYRIDNASSKTDYSGNFKFPNKSGLHTLKYDANDNVENLSANEYLRVYMDNTPPATGIDYGSPQFFDRDTLFITSDTKITLNSRDRESGVQKTEYKIDGGSMKGYSAFTIPSEGYHTVSFKATDNVNNEEQTKTSNCFVDNTPPEISVSFSIDPVGKADGLPVYPNYVRMYLGATDDHTGTERIFYKVNGGAGKYYSSPRSIDISESDSFREKKKYKVEISVEDKLGNTATKTVEFYVGSVN